jgi:uncharacterized membrane protein YbaN (DUF454 family)
MNPVRAGYLVAGLALVGVGIVGVVTPGLPGTVFLIMALFCFKRSSPRLENWMLSHPRMGPTLREWEESRSIRPRTKLVAITAIWVFIALSFFLRMHPWALAALVALGVYGTWFIASRPSSARVLAAHGD